MAEYIDVREARAYVEANYQGDPLLRHLYGMLLEKLPKVGAVEVVRCKDCKHFVQGEPYDPCECMRWKVKFGVAYTTPDGYCHKGERKDND